MGTIQTVVSAKSSQWNKKRNKNQAEYKITNIVSKGIRGEKQNKFERKTPWDRIYDFLQSLVIRSPKREVVHETKIIFHRFFIQHMSG